MLYVEPIYIESANGTSLPEVKQVVVAYQDHIVMEATFDKALNRILELVNGEIDAGDLQPEGPTPEDNEVNQKWRKLLLQAYRLIPNKYCRNSLSSLVLIKKPFQMETGKKQENS